MIKFLRNFRDDENGAVSVEWVVLTAGMVGLALGAFGALESSSASLAGQTATAIGGSDATTTIPTP